MAGTHLMRTIYNYETIPAGTHLNVLSQSANWALCSNEGIDLLRIPLSYLAHITPPPVPSFNLADIRYCMRINRKNTVENEQVTQYLTTQGRHLMQSIINHPDFPHKDLNFEGYKELDSIEAIQKLMNTFTEDLLIQEAACDAIKLYCRVESNRSRACRVLVHEGLQLLLRKFPNERNLQLKACKAIWNFCVDPANRLHAGAINIHKELQHTMYTFKDDAELQVSVCGALECYMLEEENRALVTVDAHDCAHDSTKNNNQKTETIYRTIQHTMQIHRSNVNVQASAMRALGTLCMQDSDANSEHIIEDLYVHMDAQQAMKGFPHDITIQQEGLWVLQNACANASSQQLQILGQSGLMGEIQEAMRTFREDVVVQYRACMVLACMFSDATNRVAAGKLGLQAEVVDALNLYSEERDLVEAGLLALKGYTEGSSSNVQQLNKDSIALVQTFMQKYTHTSEIQEYACGVVGNLMVDHCANREYAYTCKIHLDIQSAMREFYMERSMVYEACWALQEYMSDSQATASTDLSTEETLSTRSNRNVVVCGQAQIHREILNAMREHAHDADLQVEALSALEHYCLEDANRDKAGQSDAHLSIQQALRHHITDRNVVYSACGALAKLCMNLASTKRAGEANLHLDIQVAMQRYSTLRDIQFRACAALWMYCTDAENRERAFKANVHAEVQQAMLQFPMDIDLQCQACGALGIFCENCYSKYYQLASHILNKTNPVEAAPLMTTEQILSRILF